MSGKLHQGAKRRGSSRARQQKSKSAINSGAVHFPAGTPVCAVLADGSIYCGKVSGVENGELLLQGFRSSRKVSRNPERAKAQIASFGGLGSLFGGAGFPGAAAATGSGAAGGGLGSMLGGLFGGGGGAGTGGLGGFGGIGNMFRIGFGVVKFIFPLLKGFGV